MNYKFKIGERVTAYDNYRKGKVGVIDFVDYDDSDYTYKVGFSDDPHDFDWYQECEIESATREVWDDVKVIVDQSNPVTAPVEIKPEGRKYDSGKPRYSLLPPLALEEVVHVLTFGSQKYEDFNWMKVQNANDRYFSAANRHLWQWKRGEIMDEETKRHHLASAITNLMFILEMELAGENPT